MNETNNRDGQVAEHLKKMTEELNEASERLYALEDRLSPVLRPVEDVPYPPETSGHGVPAPEVPLAPLAEELKILYGRVRNLTRIVARTIQRLEL